MPCEYRTRAAAGTYYALRRAEPPHLIFAEPRDYDNFDAFLSQALECMRAKLLGYCWMPDAIHLALSVESTPLEEVMRRVTRYCSQRIRSRTGASVRYIASFPMMLPDQDIHLPMLLRYIHCIPVIAGAAERPEEYPYTSHRMYAGKPHARHKHAMASQAPTPIRHFH
jgi:hypothetical protein